MNIEFPYGKASVTVDVPDKNLLEVARRKEVASVKDEKAEILSAIRRPIASPKLDALVKKGSKVLVLTTNWARPMPNKALVPLLEELGRIGVRERDITLVSENGFNRKNEPDERKTLVGDPEILEKYEFVEHDPMDESSLKSNGKKTKRGTEIVLNKLAWNSDLIISTNRIDFHGMAGYMGGRKGLMPGIAGKDSIVNNHKIIFDPACGDGRLDGNPLHYDMNEFVDLAELPLFTADIVYSKDQRVLKAVAGNVHKALMEGVDFHRGTCTHMIRQAADIALVGSGGYPIDANMRHAPSAWGRTKLKKDGIIVALAKLDEKFGELGFYEFVKQFKTPEEALRALKENFIIGGWNIVYFLNLIIKNKIILVSEMPDSMVEDAFMTPAHSPKEAIEMALKEKGTDSKILVQPYNDCLCTVD